MGYSIFSLFSYEQYQERYESQMYTLLVSVLRNSFEISTWFINNASNEDFFQEFFIDCLVIDMQAFVYGLIRQAISTIMSQYQDPLDTTSLETNQLPGDDLLSSSSLKECLASLE